MTPATDLPLVVPVDEPSKAGEARRLASALAHRLGFDETARGRVSIVVTEAATNLHKHARAGRLILRALDAPDADGLEVLALDEGPGMANLDRCMADGYSTAGSPGNGFGAMMRLSSMFDVYSSTETGTAMVLRLWRNDAERTCGPGLDVGVVNLPVAGEEVSGDAWAVEERSGRSVLLVVDGLGHGLPAADAAREAVGSFRAHASQSPESIVRAAHEALKKTRGAAMAVASLDHERREVRFAGVGNISAVVLSPEDGMRTSLVSHNGTVGHSLRKVQEFAHPWPRGAQLIMHSDGVSTHWQLGRYPGLQARHPGVVAGVLYRDFRRERDDATVLVVRERGGSPP